MNASVWIDIPAGWGFRPGALVRGAAPAAVPLPAIPTLMRASGPKRANVIANALALSGVVLSAVHRDTLIAHYGISRDTAAKALRLARCHAAVPLPPNTVT